MINLPRIPTVELNMGIPDTTSYRVLSKIIGIHRSFLYLMKFYEATLTWVNS